MDVSGVVGIFVQIATEAVPVAIAFAVSAKIVHSFLVMALDGRFKL